jgi:hypothetical protein
MSKLEMVEKLTKVILFRNNKALFENLITMFKATFLTIAKWQRKTLVIHGSLA